MSTLAEIEQSAAKLSPEDKQELLLFLATRLRIERAKAPEPKRFAAEQIATWIVEDEADMNRFCGGSIFSPKD